MNVRICDEPVLWRWQRYRRNWNSFRCPIPRNESQFLPAGRTGYERRISLLSSLYPYNRNVAYTYRYSSCVNDEKKHDKTYMSKTLLPLCENALAAASAREAEPGQAEPPFIRPYSRRDLLLPAVPCWAVRGHLWGYWRGLHGTIWRRDVMPSGGYGCCLHALSWVFFLHSFSTRPTVSGILHYVSFRPDNILKKYRERSAQFVFLNCAIWRRPQRGFK